MQQQQQQQPQQMIPFMSSFPPTNITTDQIQKFLDENKQLILAIVNNQNLGKLAECAQYQAMLQKNLMYLAAIADAQPFTPTMPPQMAAHPAIHHGGYYMQHPQAATMAQQQSSNFQQFNNQQAIQGQMGVRSGAAHSGMHHGHSEVSLGNMKDDASAGVSGLDGQGSSAGGPAGSLDEAT